MVLFIATNIHLIAAILVIPVTIIKVICRNKFELHPLQFTLSYFKS